MQWRQVCALALKLPGVEESTSYGRPALEVAGKGFCFWNNPEDVVFQLHNVDEQQFLIEANPALYYITPHYNGWPAVRARLKVLDKDECRHRLEQGWRVKAPPKLLKTLEASGELPAFMKGSTAPKASAPKKSPAKKKSAAKKARS